MKKIRFNQFEIKVALFHMVNGLESFAFQTLKINLMIKF